MTRIAKVPSPSEFSSDGIVCPHNARRLAGVLAVGDIAADHQLAIRLNGDVPYVRAALEPDRSGHLPVAIEVGRTAFRRREGKGGSQGESQALGRKSAGVPIPTCCAGATACNYCAFTVALAAVHVTIRVENCPVRDRSRGNELGPFPGPV